MKVKERVIGLALVDKVIMKGGLLREIKLNYKARTNLGVPSGGQKQMREHEGRAQTAELSSLGSK